jgi:formamidopyrimidine-DNA glycosylase
LAELPELTVYVEALRPRVLGRELESVRLEHIFFLRTAEPPLAMFEGRHVRAVERIGKRIALEAEGELFLVFHLMLTGRMRWRERGAAVPRKLGLAALDFPSGSLVVTEFGSQKRASLHCVEGQEGLDALLPLGIDALAADESSFATALTAENHTLKRALTDQRLIAGIGNTYSDEILHRARMSPYKLTQQMSASEIADLYRAMTETLGEWTDTLRAEAGNGFPEKADAIRPDRAVHGRFRQPCPVCGSPVQRISYARGECNYCPTCQTDGRLLADRSLSRLLKDDWPKSVDELEESRASASKSHKKEESNGVG